ncbi:hypothetical protein PT286_04240 [Neisseriaceae bacterium ESL0693]|nr:hypothetical protein [Neisseriaceae bacterium ESL0693]
MLIKLKGVAKAKIRNPLALNPLMHKGGVFVTEKPRAVQRRERRKYKQLLRRDFWPED